MGAIGGPIQDVSIRGRLFAVAADGDATFKPSGVEAALEANGDGATSRKIITQGTWMLEGLNLSIDHDRGDMEFLIERLKESENVDITVTFASGSTWQGKGSVIGTPEFNHQKSTATVSLGGPGDATQQ